MLNAAASYGHQSQQLVHGAFSCGAHTRFYNRGMSQAFRNFAAEVNRQVTARETKVFRRDWKTLPVVPTHLKSRADHQLAMRASENMGTASLITLYATLGVTGGPIYRIFRDDISFIGKTLVNLWRVIAPDLSLFEHLQIPEWLRGIWNILSWLVNPFADFHGIPGSALPFPAFPPLPPLLPDLPLELGYTQLAFILVFPATLPLCAVYARWMWPSTCHLPLRRQRIVKERVEQQWSALRNGRRLVRIAIEKMQSQGQTDRFSVDSLDWRTLRVICALFGLEPAFTSRTLRKYLRERLAYLARDDILLQCAFDSLSGASPARAASQVGRWSSPHLQWSHRYPAAPSGTVHEITPHTLAPFLAHQHALSVPVTTLPLIAEALLERGLLVGLMESDSVRVQALRDWVDEAAPQAEDWETRRLAMVLRQVI
ncbi:hypothetical protein BKA62DRAFT_507250 [Auriculariales sp. MPI-PUGE-AT-0066]|nr:hypothetical protein BKA62DRAFT_507250 [Auriculariales sp. MPI-PUGE-AT-0066]